MLIHSGYNFSHLLLINCTDSMFLPGHITLLPASYNYYTYNFTITWSLMDRYTIEITPNSTYTDIYQNGIGVSLHSEVIYDLTIFLCSDHTRRHHFHIGMLLKL